MHKYASVFIALFSFIDLFFYVSGIITVTFCMQIEHALKMDLYVLVLLLCKQEARLNFTVGSD